MMLLTLIFIYKNYSSGAEALFVGILQGCVIALGLFIYERIKRKKQENKQRVQSETKIVESFVQSANDVELARTSSSTQERVNAPYYNCIQEELRELCNPKKFMSPYDHYKVELANEIYKTLHDDQVEIPKQSGPSVPISS